MEGYIPKIANLYPKVEFPVSTGTPPLSHLVEWNHSVRWLVFKIIDFNIKLMIQIMIYLVVGLSNYLQKSQFYFTFYGLEYQQQVIN